MSNNLRFAVIAVDAVCLSIRNGQLCLLVGKVTSNNKFKGKWAHIGGIIKVDETAEQAVDRLMRDKAGISNVFREQLYTFSSLDRDPRGRVVSVAYTALISPGIEEKNAALETKWFSLNSLPSLGYDHNAMTKEAVDRLRSKIKYTTIAQHLLPKEFTLTEFQNIYEVILGKAIDKRNFRKKVQMSGILRDTKKVQKKGRMRPATLYCFKSKDVETVGIME